MGRMLLTRATQNGQELPDGWGSTLLTRPSQNSTSLTRWMGKHVAYEAFRKMDSTYQCQAVGCIYNCYREDKLAEHVRAHQPQEAA